MLGSGADVKIGTREFMLATDVEDSYLHLYENLYGDDETIAGAEKKKTANKNILFWGYDSFVRGDGLRYWDEDDPTRWWSGNANPRIPGAITSPPTRAQTSQSTTVTPTFGGFVSVGGNLWYFTGEQGFFSTDNGATWTVNSDVATELPASYQITAVCSDGEFAYFAASDGSNRGIWRCDTTGIATDVVNAHGSQAPYKGISVREGLLYAWTGGVLFRYTLDQAGGTLPITHTAANRKYRPNAEAPTGTLYAGITSDDHVTVMMRAYDGFTEMHEWRIDPQTGKQGPRKFWTMAEGFTGKKLCIHAGVLFVLGDYQDKIGLWGYSLANKQPYFLGYVGESVAATNVRFISPSYGAQVLIGVDDATTSYIYIYDAVEDAFSQLDERTIAADGTLTDGVTSRRRRVTAHFVTTTTKFNRWNLDTDTPAESWDWDSSAHDIGYPQDEKVLLGFHVVLDPTIASSTVRVHYQIDESGSWVDTGVDATAAAKHTYVTVSSASSTVKYRTLRIRMVGSSGARCFSIFSRSYINSKQELWRLKLDLRNEGRTTRHPTDRTASGSALRDYLHTLVSDGNVVTFLDGRRYRKKSNANNTGYKTHTVLVEFPKDTVDSMSEGVCEVILRSVAPSA